MQKIIIDNECLTDQEHYLDFLENKKLWCEYLKQSVINKNEVDIEIYFTNNKVKSPIEKAIEEFLDDDINITFVHSCKEYNRVVTKRRWKTVNFGYIDDDLTPTYITEIPIPYFEFLEHIQKEGTKCVLANIIVVKQVF